MRRQWEWAVSPVRWAVWIGCRRRSAAIRSQTPYHGAGAYALVVLLLLLLALVSDKKVKDAKGREKE